MTPLISVIVAVYNGENYLEDCLNSLLKQTYERTEYIVIDGGSTDSTLNIIKKYEKHLTYWISEPDKGVYDAWNKGINTAKGEWIAFIGSDDIYLPNALENYVDYLKTSNSSFDYISSKVVVVDRDLTPKRVIGDGWNWFMFKKYMNTAHVGSLHSISYFKKYGLYDLSFKIVGDYEMLLRAGENLIAGFVNTETALMRMGGISDSTKAIKEKRDAKIKHRTMSKFSCNIDYYMGYIKYNIRKILL